MPACSLVVSLGKAPVPLRDKTGSNRWQLTSSKSEKVPLLTRD